MKYLISVIFHFILTFSMLNAQTAFNMKDEFPNPSFDPNPDFGQIKSLQYDKIFSAFNFISAKSNMQFNYPQGGCPERAIVMHYILDSMGIPNFRIWVFAPSRLIEKSSEKMFILDKNNLTTDNGNKIQWDFHVAPCVLGSNETARPDTFVIDPSLRPDKPLKVQEWLSCIGNHEHSKYSFLDGNFYQFNRKDSGNSNVINGFFYSYNDGAYDNLWVEKMMALNQTAYAMYLKYVKDDDRSLKQVSDIMTVIGNSATLKEVLEYKNGQPAQSKIRYVISNYPQFVTDSWTMYSQCLVAWVSRMKALHH